MDKNEKKVCQKCGKPLLRLPWNTKGDMLVCDNSNCKAFRQPQGWVEEIRKDMQSVLRVKTK